MTVDNVEFKKAVRGCLFGGAVGDALGLEVEFKTLDLIHQIFGSEGIKEPVLTGGESFVSDDTQMTMFTLDGIFAHLNRPNSDPISEVKDAYLKWYLTQERDRHWVAPDEPLRLEDEPALNHLRAPGRTCLRALAGGGNGTMEVPENDSKGCGGVMRVAPIGLVRQWTAAECFQFGAQTAAITHGHPTGFLSSGAMAFIIREIIDGTHPNAASRLSLLELEKWTDHDETSEAIKKVLLLIEENAPATPMTIKSLGEGWIAEEALAIGLFSALASQSFSDAVCLAANHSGDSDSTASIAGQIYGAWHGDEGIPEIWVSQLDVYDPLDRLINDFLAIV